MKEFLQSAAFEKSVRILGILLIALAIFSTGIAVGYKRAEFSYQWGRNYSGNMMDPHSMMAPFAHDADDVTPYGAIGSIVSVRLPEMMIKGPYEDEKIILLKPDTAIRRMHAVASTSDLVAGEQIIVIGSPDQQGIIEASLIRIGPDAPPIPGQALIGSSINNK